jgi:hypothetical protein
MKKNILWIPVPWILVALALFSCGGGGGGSSSATPPAVIQGSVSGTIVMGIDENGEIEDKDDTTGRSPVNSTLPAKYPFSLKVRHGHKYRIHFIVGHGTPSERIVPLTSGTTDIFSIAASAVTIDMGFVDTSQASATAEKDPLTQSGCTSGGQAGPKTLRVEGYKYLNLIDNTDATVKYRAQVQVKDAAGNPLTSGALVKAMKVYDNTWTELSPNGNLFFWNGSGMYIDSAGTQVLTPMSDVELYLAASPGNLPGGFYTVAITDNNGNLYTTPVYSKLQRTVSKPSNLQQVINPVDNSITLSWTNPPQITSDIYGEYQIYVFITGNDLNGDGSADAILYAIRVPPFDSYTIPASFVSSNLAGKAGLKWRVEIRQRTPAAISFPDNTSLQPQFYRNYSATSDLTLPAPVTGNFTQADLTGTWDAMHFRMGIASGWKHWTMTSDNSGGQTYTSYLDSSGSTTPPPAGAVIWTISTTGVVSESGASGNSTFHGQMSSNRQLVIGTDSRDTGQTKVLRVYRKRTGTAFTSADLANKTFTFHSLNSGTDNQWTYGAGTSDGSGLVTLTSVVEPSGPQPPGSGGTWSVSSAGIATIAGDNTWYGLMTDDKKVIFVIQSNPPATNAYSFGVITFTGQTYTQSDYAGTYNFSAIRNTVPNPLWAYGVTSADAAGNGTYLSYTDSAGSATPANFTRVLSATGVLTDPADATYHGQLSYNKDISVRTNTSASSGRYGLTIGFK